MARPFGTMKTHCKRGHALTDDNVYATAKISRETGAQYISRQCRTCNLERSKERVRKAASVMCRRRKHELAGDNVLIARRKDRNGNTYTTRICRACRREWQRLRRAAEKRGDRAYVKTGDRTVVHPWQFRTVEPVDPLRGVRRDDDYTESRVGCAAAMCVAVGA